MRFKIACLLMLAFIAPALADEYRSKINEGYDYYKNGEYDKAAEQFKNAGILKPEKALPVFNKGTALYKSNDFEGAAGEFEGSAGKNDPNLKADAFYNAGNAYFEAKKYDQAIKSYIDALRLNPKDKDGKHNLEMALLQKKMQQQQQKQDKNKDEKQKQDKQEKNKPDQNKQDKNKQDQNQQPQSQKEKDKQSPGSPQEQKMNQKQAQELLARYADDEKEVQKRLKQVNVRSRSTNDW